MEHFIELSIRYDLNKCFNHYGIEGTLEVIERVYKHNLTLKEHYIDVYKQMIKGK